MEWSATHLAEMDHAEREKVPIIMTVGGRCIGRPHSKREKAQPPASPGLLTVTVTVTVTVTATITVTRDHDRCCHYQVELGEGCCADNMWLEMYEAPIDSPSPSNAPSETSCPQTIPINLLIPHSSGLA